jgi:opacity protein-like surface antigen
MHKVLPSFRGVFGLHRRQTSRLSTSKGGNEMFRRILGVFMIGSCLVVPGIASAQERSPHTGSTAVGVDVGAFIPSADELESALIVNALFDYYVTPRVSLRTVFGLTDPGFSQESSDSLRQIPLRLDVNYNWERGKWHPFVGAGVGAYFLRFKDNGQAFGDTETKAGFNLGGGMEYFTGRTVSIKGEARYHVIGDTRNGTDPSGFVLTGGLKKYW